jgi:ribonuclease P protein component
VSRLQKSSIESISGYGVFSQVISKGKRYEVKPLRAFVKNNGSDRKRVQIGIAIGKQNWTAVERNRLRRLLREAIRETERVFDEFVESHRTLEIVIMYTGSKEIAPKKVRFFSIKQAMYQLLAVIIRNEKECENH